MHKKTILLSLTIVCGLCLSLFYTLKRYNPRPLPISVVMSTYNRADLLPTAIETILNQTFSDFEFIIINDGSNDHTAQVLDAYSKKDNRIKIITNETNLGLIDSLNKGLSIARGRYIARMDDDDKSVPTRLQLQYDFMERNQDVTVTGTTQHAHDDKLFVPVQKVSVATDSDELSVSAHFNVPILHPSAMIRNDFLKTHHIYYKKGYDSAEDTPFWLDIVKKHGKIIKLTPPLVINKSNTPKKEGYHKQQLASYVKFLNTYLTNIRQNYTFSEKWLTNDEKCFIIQQLKKHPTDYYSAEAAEKLFKTSDCAMEYGVLNHLDKSFLVKIEQNRYTINNHSFSLIKKEGNVAHLQNKDITFQLSKEGETYTVSGQSHLIKITHPHWKDYALISNKAVSFLSGHRSADLIFFDENMLEVKFHGWGKEIFEKNAEGSYHFSRKDK